MQTSQRTPEAIGVTLAQRLAAAIEKNSQNAIFDVQCKASFGGQTLTFKIIYNRQARTLLKSSVVNGNQSYRGRVFRNVDDAAVRDMAATEASSPSG
jgi:hypothetical protein